MTESWDHLGDLSNITQLVGVDAVRLIGMIVQAANTARMHKRNCQQFAKHLKLIGNLLEQLKISELKKYPETREPLEQLEDALRRSYILVNSCKDRSYFYLLAMGWNIVYQFRRAQSEIDRYLRIIPLITLVDNARVKQKLENIEKHECEYTFDEEDKKAQDVILSRDTSVHDPVVLKKTLSCSYPNLPFEKALKKENEKLQMELQRSQNDMDANQCEVIEHLLELTEVVEKSLSDGKNLKKVESRDSYSSNEKEKEHKGSNYSHGDGAHNHGNSRSVSSTSSSHDLISKRGSSRRDDWNMDLLDCCSEPYLCLKTCFYPCGTFSKISTVANNRHISSDEACNDIMAYSLILSCCCYTCCVRSKLRYMLNIKGGCCDDFLSHLICCCCALVQEWREIEIREAYDKDLGKTVVNAPSFQYMES